MQGFPREERLLSRQDYLRISVQGHKLHAPHFILIYRFSAGIATRIGLTVSRKVGNAVVRNRVKRFIREFYRQNKELFPPVDFNIIARQGAGGLDSGEVGRELTRALRNFKNV